MDPPILDVVLYFASTHELVVRFVLALVLTFGTFVKFFNK